jgi:hypothetical protein
MFLPMEDVGSINSIAPYAAVAFVLAGLFWMAVGSVAMKRSNRPGGDNLAGTLAVAAYATGVAFLLGFAAWLG